MKSANLRSSNAITLKSSTYLVSEERPVDEAVYAGLLPVQHRRVQLGGEQQVPVDGARVVILLRGRELLHSHS